MKPDSRQTIESECLGLQLLFRLLSASQTLLNWRQLFPQYRQPIPEGKPSGRVHAKLRRSLPQESVVTVEQFRKTLGSLESLQVNMGRPSPE